MSRTDNIIHVSDEFTGVLRQVRNEISNQRDQIDAIKRTMASLQSVWDSPAQRKFSDRFNADSRDMTEFLELLSQYLNEIERLANSYSNADTSLRANLSNVQC